MKCEQCGIEFEVARYRTENGVNRQRFHNKECRDTWRRSHETDGITRICKGCGLSFRPKRLSNQKGEFHSRECAFEYFSKHRETKKKQRQRQVFLLGLLRAFGNIKKCRVCGALSFTSECSDECRKKYNKQIARQSKKTVCDKDTFRCYQCGKEYKPEYGDRKRRFCSDWHARIFAKRQSKRKTRARKWKSEYIFERFADWEIFERDGWRCMICGLPVRRDVDPSTHNQGPTIDHIIPLSQGGSHIRRNVQCAHRICNTIKSDRTLSEARQLIAS